MQFIFFVKDLFKILSKVKNLKNLKLITGQTDHNVNKNLFSYKPSCIKDWYSINVDYSNENLHPIPLGLANKFSSKNLLINEINKFPDENEKIEKIYLNFETNTNYFLRKRIKNHLKDKSFVIQSPSNLSLSEYAKDLKTYKYILCPNGNGIDTHRLWETLYSGSIPIIFDHLTYKTTENLPVIKINKKSNINIEYLDEQLTTFDNLINRKLNIKYWMDEIKNNIISSNEKAEVILSESEIGLIKLNYFNKLKKERQKKLLYTLMRKAHSRISFN